MLFQQNLQEYSFVDHPCRLPGSHLLTDPVEQAIANVHAGWKGNVKNIYEKTVQFMQQCYGSSPKNIHVCIAPSLWSGRCSIYKLSPGVAAGVLGISNKTALLRLVEHQ